jgi:transcriptional regulator with XRE-family HTH domain
LSAETGPINAARLREIRKEIGVTQGRLGEIIGVDGATISRWESDANPAIPNGLPAILLKAIDKVLKKRKKEEVKNQLWDWMAFGGLAYVAFKILESYYDVSSEAEKKAERKRRR